MKQSLRLGRVAGIPVGINWSVLVILVLITDIVAGNVLPRADAGRSTSVYWAIAIPTAVLFLASLLAHEGAHAAIARRRGVGVRSITLWMLGGVAQLDGEPQNARADFAIAAAGPLTSLAIAGALFAAAEAAASFGVPVAIAAALGRRRDHRLSVALRMARPDRRHRHRAAERRCRPRRLARRA